MLNDSNNSISATDKHSISYGKSNHNSQAQSESSEIHAIDLEIAILGGVLLDRSSIKRVKDILKPEHFYLNSHKLIYQAQLEIDQEGREPDLRMVALRLRDKGQLDVIGGQLALANLVSGTISSINIDHYAKLVVEKAVLRQRVAAADGLAKELMSKFPDPEKIAKYTEIITIDEKRLTDPAERFKLELQNLRLEDDPVKRLLLRSKIASHYRIKATDLEQALRQLDQRNKTPEAQCLSLAELFDLPETDIGYLIPGMLPAGDTVILVGDPKSGKSLLAYDAAFAVATGEDDFLGERCNQGNVLIVQTDESIGTAKGRLKKRGFRSEDAERVRFMSSFNMSQMTKLEEHLENFKPKLVIIDSLRRICSGRELSENSAEFADMIYELKELLARYGAAGILIHHANKSSEAVGVGRVRGSSAIAGSVWGVWQIDQIPKKDPNNKKKLVIDPKDLNRILSIHARDTEGARLRIELDPSNNSWISHGEEGTTEQEVSDRKTIEARTLELLRSVSPTGLEGIEIGERLGEGKGIYTCLNRMIGKRLIGSRPSTKDRRRTVYFCTTGIDNTEECTTSDFHEGHSPPPVIVSNVDYYPETLTGYEIEDSQQLVNNSITISQQVEALKQAVDYSNPELVIDSEIVNIDHTQGGGVCPSQELLTNICTTESTQIEQSANQSRFTPGQRVRRLEDGNEYTVISCSRSHAQLEGIKKVVPVASLEAIE
jgi:archaellum biogenesis ATPase FlaH